MLKAEGKGLMIRGKLFLSFVALAMGTRKSWSPDYQWFACRHQVLF